jgi:hypothetical protein
MININKIIIRIKAQSALNINETKIFGRKLDFKKGLNLVVGDNTSGKTSIVECLFYGLGMEELIEGKIGIHSLDKAVKSLFSYIGDDGKSHEWRVLESSVFLEISNDTDKIITLKRIMASQSSNRFNVIYIWNETYKEELEYADSREFYLHNPGDHSAENGIGFYSYLANFAELPIISVDSRKGDKTTLYMQILFCATYIEQKRGWSDFFANIRSFNILNQKQRLIEYLMKYRTNEDLNTIYKLKEERNKCENNWRDLVVSINNLLSYNNICQEGLSLEIKKQNVSLDEIRCSVRLTKIDINTYIKNLQIRISELNSKQKSKTNSINNDKYVVAIQEYKVHKEKYDSFCLELDNEKEKLDSINKQLNQIDEEIKLYNGLSHVNNIITTHDVKICPTCHRPLLNCEATETNITSASITESGNILSMERNFLQPIQKRLTESIRNRELNKLYLEKQLSIEGEKLKSYVVENDILCPLTTDEQFELANSESIVASLKQVIDRIDFDILQLKKIKECYVEVCNKIKIINAQEEKTQPIYKQLDVFKRLLNKFDYSSNIVSSEVFFKEEDSTYKYLPVVRHREDEEEIRSDSSASDFVRSIWAYYLSILKLGKRHPGFLVMDEPCQHSMKEKSLQHLFEYCAGLTDKQIILFCSSQPITEEKENNESDTENLIETLAKKVESEGFNLNYLTIEPKAITFLGDENEKSNDVN